MAAAAMIPTLAFSSTIDLTPAGTQSLAVAGAVGGAAIVSDYWLQPAGTGVFNPFLTLDANGKTSTGSNDVEQAYNTDGYNALYMDCLRPHWNTTLHVSDLATITLNQINYYGFILDANEPGGAKSLISVDNIRIYTSATDNTASVGDDVTKLDNLGTLRWAMNNPTLNADGSFNTNTWIKLDASQENIDMGSNGGSGMADMIIYIPQTAFGTAAGSDYVWFYNLNGAHANVDQNLASTAGFEEWSAVRGNTAVSTPDEADTLLLLALSFLAFASFGFRAARVQRVG
ncbi:MAG: hypothetical protein JWM88_300 [Verrucomicrobia bacterium]|nr:hypothetical protein [Verrucomicrobiota bacterium]